MELKDTITMMNSADYRERFKAEYYQLKIRCEKLSTMLKKYREGTLHFQPACPYEVLVAQLAYMQTYFDCLEDRAQIEGINLREKLPVIVEDISA